MIEVLKQYALSRHTRADARAGVTTAAFEKTRVLGAVS